jgi:hypothetical protein
MAGKMVISEASASSAALMGFRDDGGRICRSGVDTSGSAKLDFCPLEGWGT